MTSLKAHFCRISLPISDLRISTCERHAACFKGIEPRRSSSSSPEQEEENVEAMFAGQAAVEVGRLLGRTVTPREITALFYERAVADDLGPVVGGRRLISPEAVEVIVAALREKDAARQQGKGGEGESRSD